MNRPAFPILRTRRRAEHGGIISLMLLVIVLVVVGYLLLAPTAIQPVSWQPPKAPGLVGVYADNSRLSVASRIGQQLVLNGPESFVIDKQGRVIAGLADGRVVRMSADAQSIETLINTGGRPLGLALHRDGRLIIADARKGLLALSQDNNITELSKTADGVAFGFPDDVTVSADGRYAYFSDASSRWGYGQDGDAVMEHSGDGRLLRYDFKTQQTIVLLNHLEFANGVALGPNEAYVLVNETGAYRITRYWLTGAKAGSHDIFIDNLPGLPDNLSFNGKDRFWVAIFTPRNVLLDATAQYPFLRKVFSRALAIVPKPIEHRAMAIGLDTDGHVIANLQDAGHGNYSPITSVREYGNWLWFGSLTADSLARMPLSLALPSTPAASPPTQR